MGSSLVRGGRGCCWVDSAVQSVVSAALAPRISGEAAPLSAVGGSDLAAPGVNQATAGCLEVR